MYNVEGGGIRDQTRRYVVTDFYVSPSSSSSPSSSTRV
jgi:hypothetical protein